jgi:CBS domain-containing protein
MSIDPLTIGAQEPISTAAEVMLDGGVRHLPVVVDDVLVGFVSIRDVLAVFTGRT